MIWLHNMMEVTEGPVSKPMMDAYARINAEGDAATEKYNSALPAAVEAFEGAIE